MGFLDYPGRTEVCREKYVRTAASRREWDSGPPAYDSGALATIIKKVNEYGLRQEV